MAVILQNAPANEPVFLFMDKKRSEGKHFYVYMMAGANKFLRIYYARVMEHLNKTQPAAWFLFYIAAVLPNGFLSYAFLSAKKLIFSCLFSLDFYLQVC